MAPAFSKNKITSALLALLLTWNASAHRADDVLQACLVEVTPTEALIHLNLNPGEQVADSLIWMMDRNGDREISAEEARAYGAALVGQLELSLDGRTTKLELLAVECATAAELRTGDGLVRFEIRASLGKGLRNGQHKLHFENRHLPGMGVYLLNAVKPTTTAVRILKQDRNEDQRAGSISFLTQ